MIKNITLFAAFTLLIILIASCSDDNEPTEISYNSDVSVIMSSQCTACHSGNSPSGNLRLTNYSEVKTSAESGILMNRLNDANNPMPPTGLLPQENRNTIQEWIDNGFVE